MVTSEAHAPSCLEMFLAWGASDVGGVMTVSPCRA